MTIDDSPSIQMHRCFKCTWRNIRIPRIPIEHAQIDSTRRETNCKRLERCTQKSYLRFGKDFLTCQLKTGYFCKVLGTEKHFFTWKPPPLVETPTFNSKCFWFCHARYLTCYFTLTVYGLDERGEQKTLSFAR